MAAPCAHRKYRSVYGRFREGHHEICLAERDSVAFECKKKIKYCITTGDSGTHLLKYEIGPYQTGWSPSRGISSCAPTWLGTRWSHGHRN